MDQPPPPSRFRTSDETLQDFGGEALVACPRCEGRAPRIRWR